MKKYFAFILSMLFFGCSQLKEKIAPIPSTKAEFSYQIGSLGSVSFADKSLNATSLKWDLGDGTTSTSQYPSTNYLKNGQYVVTLTATGKGGSDVISKTISIVDIPGNLTVYSGSANNTKNINVYVDGVFFGTISGKVYYPTAPSCRASSTIYGPLTQGQHNLTASEQGGSRTWSSKVTVYSGQCFVFGLI